MKAINALWIPWLMAACSEGAPPDAIPAAPTLRIAVFASPTSQTDLTALQEAFPHGSMELVDHLFYPDKAKELGVPSNGFAHLQRIDASNQPIGDGRVTALDSSPSDLQSLQDHFNEPMTRVHVSAPSTASSDPKTQFSLLSRRLLQHDMVQTALEAENDFILWIAGPDDLTEDELLRLRHHRAEGRPLLIALEPHNSDTTHSRLHQLLASIGAEIRPGQVASDHQQVWETLGTPSAQDRFNHAANRFMAHPALSVLGQGQSTELSVIFSNAAIIQPRHGGAAETTPIVLSHKESWTEITLDGQVSDGEKSGAFPLALATKSEATAAKTVIIADSTALSNRWALHPGNHAFLADLLNWLTPKAPTETTDLTPNPENVEPMPVLASQHPLRRIELRQEIRSLSLTQKTDSHGEHIWVRISGVKNASEFLGNRLTQAAFDDLNGLRSIRQWPAPSRDRLEALGLSPHNGELILTAQNGARHTLLLGDSPFNAQGRYALDPQSETVHLLTSEGVEGLLGPEQQLEEHRVLPDSEWTRFELEGTVRPKRIEQRETQWILAGRQTRHLNPTATELAQHLLSLRTADAEGSAPSGPAAFEAAFFDDENHKTRLILHQTPEGWLAYSDYSRAWGKISPRIAEKIVELAKTLQ